MGGDVVNPAPRCVSGDDAVGRAALSQATKHNPVGGVDLYTGPTAPVGTESNWMKTVREDGWFIYFPLIAPTERFLRPQWALPDFETGTR